MELLYWSIVYAVIFIVLPVATVVAERKWLK